MANTSSSSNGAIDLSVGASHEHRSSPATAVVGSKTVSKSPTASRLMHDFVHIKREPIPYMQVEFDPADIYEWHFVVRGLENTLLMGGFFHGKLLFPANFPFEPPQVVILTPIGCFAAAADPIYPTASAAEANSSSKELVQCSFSPDQWSPAMSVRSLLTAVLWNIFSDSALTGTCTSRPLDLSKDHAKESNKANLQDADFRKLFPALVDEIVNCQSEEETAECLSELEDDDDDYYDVNFNFLLR